MFIYACLYIILCQWLNQINTKDTSIPYDFFKLKATTVQVYSSQLIGFQCLVLCEGKFLVTVALLYGELSNKTDFNTLLSISLIAAKCFFSRFKVPSFMLFKLVNSCEYFLTCTWSFVNVFKKDFLNVFTFANFFQSVPA